MTDKNGTPLSRDFNEYRRLDIHPDDQVTEISGKHGEPQLYVIRPQEDGGYLSWVCRPDRTIISGPRRHPPDKPGWESTYTLTIS